MGYTGYSTRSVSLWISHLKDNLHTRQLFSRCSMRRAMNHLAHVFVRRHFIMRILDLRPRIYLDDQIQHDADSRRHTHFMHLYSHRSIYNTRQCLLLKLLHQVGLVLQSSAPQTRASDSQSLS
jgi:hypothetical protein